MLEKFLEYGLSIIPIGTNKCPCFSLLPLIDGIRKWEPYSQKMATIEEIQKWQLPIAIIGGQISGGLVCVDFDDHGSCLPEFKKEIETEAPGLYDKMVIEKTPSGGFHLIYRTTEKVPSVKLARKKEKDVEGKDVLIECKAEGGYFIACPSITEFGAYTMVQGKFSDISNISQEEHEIVFSIARSFEQKITEPKKQAPLADISGWETTPFDDYNNRTDPLLLLEEEGWTQIFNRGEAIYLKRPGKKERGISASWNHIPGRFYSFSSNCSPFEPNHPYQPAQVYTILNHGGDYKAAARALFDKGFGIKKEITMPVSDKKEVQPSKLVRVEDIADAVCNYYQHGKPKGFSTGWTALDSFYKIAKGQLNIITGVPSHGKSEWLDALLINLTKQYDWKFLIYSPENYPYEVHFQKLAEKHSGKYFFGLARPELASEIDYLRNRFSFFQYNENPLTIEEAIKTMDENKGFDGIVIDPWNEIENNRPENSTETEYIGSSLSKLRIAARRTSMVVWVVAHPTKLKKEKVGNGKWEYPVPSMYDITGSANWYNKADNGIVVYRNFEQNFTEIFIQKIKFKHYGKPGSIRFKYDVACGRYSVLEEKTENTWGD